MATASLLVLLFLAAFPPLASPLALPPLPLSTSSRFVTDAAGRRVKLACTSWAAHLQPVVAEGLSRRPLPSIAAKVAAMGFNCVRLTWPLWLATNASLGLETTVRESFVRLGLVESVAGVRVNNAELLNVPLLHAFSAVIQALAKENIMVILDNHITVPEWCCSSKDENGFFGDKYFDPEEWLEGLKTMATMAKNSSNVVGMSLRNELRGPRQNVSLWYRYMQLGAETVHAANPCLLVILSGLEFDKDLSYLSSVPVKLSFNGKLVFEFHWYGFGDPVDWEHWNPNDACSIVTAVHRYGSLFLLDKGFPVFLSEFGGDQSGTHLVDNRYLNCLFGVLAELDIDWGVWALQGSYYIREGILSYDESYGMLTWDWCSERSPAFIRRLAAVQTPFQGPGLSNKPPHNVVFHSLTGLCVLTKPGSDALVLGPCVETRAWNYTSKHELWVKGTPYCVQAKGVGKPARLGIDCWSSSSKWEMISASGMHLSAELTKNGTRVCLDADSQGAVVTNPCKCLTVVDGTCSPESQWFKVVFSNREVAAEKSKLVLPYFRNWVLF